MFHIYGKHPELEREAYVPIIFNGNEVLGDELKVTTNYFYFKSKDSPNRLGVREKLRIRLREGKIYSLHIETYSGLFIFRNYKDFVWCDRINAREGGRF